MGNFIIFLGAVASKPFGIPTMTQLLEGFENQLKVKLAPEIDLFKEIKSKLQSYENYDIEALITVLQDIVSIDKINIRVFNKPSVHYFSTWDLGFKKMLELSIEKAIRNQDKAKNLLIDVKNYIADACCIKTQQPYDLYDEFFHQIIFQNQGMNYLDHIVKIKGPKQIQCYIFTTNYDKVIESYCHRKEIVYHCGEIQNGTVDMRNISGLFSTDSIFHVIKLHGSTYWYIDGENRMCWLTHPAKVGSMTHLGDVVVKELAIYPAQEKYTFREPFYNMFHYLKERLTSCDICYVVGYSFRDDDILGLFIDALDLNKRLSLELIDPNALDIINEIFPKYKERIRPIQSDFSIQSVKFLTH